MKIKYPATQMAPQANGNKDWNIGYVSPHDGTPVRYDSDSRTLTDQHGNSFQADGLAPSRKHQIFDRRHREIFDNIPPPRPTQKTLRAQRRSAALQSWGGAGGR